MKFNLTNIGSKVTRVTGRGGLIVRKFSPEILIATGIIGIVTSTVMACKATSKAEDVIEAAQTSLDNIAVAKDKASSEGYVGPIYGDAEANKETAIVYGKAALGFAKVYGPSVTLGLVSIGCILGAHNIMRKRNVALGAAYKLVEQSFKDYRRRVVEELGAEKDKEFKYGIKHEQIVHAAYTDDNGVKHKAEKETVKVIEPGMPSMYAKFFDESSCHWEKNADYNLMFLSQTQKFMNDKLNANGHLFLNEVYDALDIPRTTEGQLVGWVAGHGDGYVDFNIYDGASIAKRNFVNGYERAILLDFNVDGVILELI